MGTERVRANWTRTHTRTDMEDVYERAEIRMKDLLLLL